MQPAAVSELRFRLWSSDQEGKRLFPERQLRRILQNNNPCPIETLLINSLKKEDRLRCLAGRVQEVRLYRD